MCGGGGGLKSTLDKVSDFHPLSGIIDQPVIDPILQGDTNVKNEVVPGSYLDKKDKNLGVDEVQPVIGMFANAIFGSAGASAGANAAGGTSSFPSSDLEATGTSAPTAFSSTPTAGAGGEDFVLGDQSDPAMLKTGGTTGDPVDAINNAPAGSISKGLSDSEVAGSPFAAPATPGATDPNQNQTDPNATTAQGAQFIDATTPTVSLDQATADPLGITQSSGFPGDPGNSFGNTFGVPPGGAGSGFADVGSEASGFPGDPANAGFSTGDVTGPSIYDDGAAAATKTPGVMDTVNAGLKKAGLTPTTAGLLGVAGLQALSKPKTTSASRALENTSTPNAQAASAQIQSGGTTGPGWAQQKSSIDATIDEQIKQQTQAILQQAQNSGQGANSQVTIQQINKLKNQLETQRQTLYVQAQAQNVQAALQELGIADQALNSVANAQLQASNAGKASAAQTAQLALMLQQLSRGST